MPIVVKDAGLSGLLGVWDFFPRRRIQFSYLFRKSTVTLSSVSVEVWLMDSVHLFRDDTVERNRLA